MTNRPDFFHLDEDEDDAPESKKDESPSSMMEKALFESRTIILAGGIVLAQMLIAPLSPVALAAGFGFGFGRGWMQQAFHIWPMTATSSR